jgi:hypothetical protein
VVLGVFAVLACLCVAVAGESESATTHYLLAGLTGLAGAAVCVYSFLFPVIVASLLFEGVATGSVASLLATGSGAAAGVLCVITAASQRRSAARACDACGRIHGRSPESRADQAPRWAFVGAYLAVAGFAARISVWLADTIAGRWQASVETSDVSWPAMITFVALMSVAGTVLPLALVHRWGRIWPAWTGPLRGRHVPRWLVLGTGLFMGASLTAYFGIAGMIAWILGEFGGSFVPLMLEMGGYTIWGVGLLVSATSYFALTRPPCPLTVHVHAQDRADQFADR